jgi:RNA polymerase sigma-70 factor (ECF subfamily)
MTDQLEQLWRAEKPTVYRFVRGRTTSHEQAEDVVADVFLAACSTCAADSTCELSVGWLLTVARRRLIDGWRRSTRDRAMEARVRDQQRLELVDEWGRAAEDGTVEMAAAATAVGQLPPRQAEVVRMRCLLDLPAATVAERMGTSPDAVDSLLARARRNLCAVGVGCGSAVSDPP